MNFWKNEIQFSENRISAFRRLDYDPGPTSSCNETSGKPLIPELNWRVVRPFYVCPRLYLVYGSEDRRTLFTALPLSLVCDTVKWEGAAYENTPSPPSGSISRSCFRTWLHHPKSPSPSLCFWGWVTRGFCISSASTSRTKGYTPPQKNCILKLESIRINVFR